MNTWQNSEELNPRATDFFVKEVLNRYFDKADEDYITARILFLDGLFISFLWMAQQTLEKYLKSALLLRGMEITKNHDLKWHFKRLRSADDIDLPPVLLAPKTLRKLPDQQVKSARLRPWPFQEEMTQFVSKISKEGGTASRYNETDYDIQPYDLVMFDLISRHLRDAAINTPNYLLHRDINEDKNGEVLFGHARATGEIVKKLKKHNYAYWPNLDHGDWTGFSMGFRNNASRKNIFENDQDYKSATQLIESLTLD